MDARSAVTELIHGLLDAWNRKDRSAFCGHFTSGAIYLTGEGELRQGPISIGGLMDEPQSTSRVQVDGPIEVRDHGGLLTGIFHWRSLPDVQPAGRGVVTCVIVNQSGRWLIDTLQSTDVIRGKDAEGKA